MLLPMLAALAFATINTFIYVFKVITKNQAGDTHKGERGGRRDAERQSTPKCIENFLAISTEIRFGDMVSDFCWFLRDNLHFSAPMMKFSDDSRNIRDSQLFISFI